jgi:hypothetical protein
MLKQQMEYHNEIITITSLREDAANQRKLYPKTEKLITNTENRKKACDFESKEENSLLTTQEACKLLRCSKATLWTYAKEGIIKPWQRKKRGLTRWPISELGKI